MPVPHTMCHVCHHHKKQYDHFYPCLLKGNFLHVIHTCVLCRVASVLE